MIRFTCEYCQRKIRVADNVAGKKGRCPNCKQPVTVPELALQDLVADLSQKPAAAAASVPNTQAVIAYECQMCQNKLTSPKEDQGKIKECPHCGCFVEVVTPHKKPIPDVDDKLQLQPRPPVEDDYDDPYGRIDGRVSDAVNPKPKRLLPIFLDVFLYPLNKFGLLALSAFTLAPIVLYPVAFLGVFGPLLYLLVMVCVWAYMFWYFSLCIQKSAEGGIRAPDTFNEDMNVQMTDMVFQMLRTILQIIICLLPAFIYRVLADSAGAVFYGIMAGCIFFLPMMLLASVMFDSFWAAWNPRVILGGMFSSFFGYLVLVLAFYIPVGLYFYISQLGRSQENMVLALILNGCSIYLIMISSHLLGWFFYKNEEKLYWSV
ncbi:MAG: hypothetical protein ACYTFX_02745 [Planctomycetota bacterium]|jgi:hypothetical protein